MNKDDKQVSISKSTSAYRLYLEPDEEIVDVEKVVNQYLGKIVWGVGIFFYVGLAILIAFMMAMNPAFFIAGVVILGIILFILAGTFAGRKRILNSFSALEIFTSKRIITLRGMRANETPYSAFNQPAPIRLKYLINESRISSDSLSRIGNSGGMQDFTRIRASLLHHYTTSGSRLQSLIDTNKKELADHQIKGFEVSPDRLNQIFNKIGQISSTLPWILAAIAVICVTLVIFAIIDFFIPEPWLEFRLITLAVVPWFGSLFFAMFYDIGMKNKRTMQQIDCIPQKNVFVEPDGIRYATATGEKQVAFTSDMIFSVMDALQNFSGETVNDTVKIVKLSDPKHPLYIGPVSDIDIFFLMILHIYHQWRQDQHYFMTPEEIRQNYYLNNPEKTALIHQFIENAKLAPVGSQSIPNTIGSGSPVIGTQSHVSDATFELKPMVQSDLSTTLMYSYNEYTVYLAEKEPIYYVFHEDADLMMRKTIKRGFTATITLFALVIICILIARGILFPGLGSLVYHYLPFPFFEVLALFFGMLSGGFGLIFSMEYFSNYTVAKKKEVVFSDRQMIFRIKNSRAIIKYSEIEYIRKDLIAHKNQVFTPYRVGISKKLPNFGYYPYLNILNTDTRTLQVLQKLNLLVSTNKG